MDKIKILFFSENSADAVSLYRGSGVLNHLVKNYEGITFETISGAGGGLPDWDVLSRFDILFLQRPASGFAISLMAIALQCNLKLWVDMDDWLLGLTPDNVHHDLYESRKAIVSEIIRTSAVTLTVSTPHLAELYRKHGAKNVIVIPNAMDFDWLGTPRFLIKPQKTDFCWRGSATHSLDLHEYHNEINRAMRSVEYIGMRPVHVREEDIYTRPMPIMEYYINLRHGGRPMFFVCLHDSDFNRAKSNICYIEATWAGAIVLAPDWEEWRRPGIINYTSKEDFVQKAQEMAAYTIPERQNIWWEANRYVTDNLSLEVVNKQRYELIKEIIG